MKGQQEVVCSLSVADIGEYWCIFIIDYPGNGVCLGSRKLFNFL